MRESAYLKKKKCCYPNLRYISDASPTSFILRYWYRTYTSETYVPKCSPWHLSLSWGVRPCKSATPAKVNQYSKNSFFFENTSWYRQMGTTRRILRVVWYRQSVGKGVTVWEKVKQRQKGQGDPVWGWQICEWEVSDHTHEQKLLWEIMQSARILRSFSQGQTDWEEWCEVPDRVVWPSAWQWSGGCLGAGWHRNPHVLRIIYSIIPKFIWIDDEEVVDHLKLLCSRP